MISKTLKKSFDLVKTLKFDFPLNHLFVIFRLFGLAAYKRNKSGLFQICHVSKLISFIMPFFLSFCFILVTLIYIQLFDGYLPVPILLSFLAWGGGSVASYVAIVFRNSNICRLMNEMVQLKKIFSVKSPTYTSTESDLVIVPFWLGLLLITFNDIFDLIVNLNDDNTPFTRIAIYIINDMHFLLDMYFAAVIVAFLDLSKCFRYAFNLENETFIQTIANYNVRRYDIIRRKSLVKIMDSLDFFKKNYHRLHDMREKLNQNFGIVNFVNVTFVLISLIQSTYINTKRYSTEPFDSIRDYIFYTFLYGGKLIVVLNICTKIYEEDYKLGRQLHLAFLEFEDVEIQEEVQINSLQLLHHTFQFDAKGFFNLNFTLAMSITSVVATYAIILIQLQIGEDLCKV